MDAIEILKKKRDEEIQNCDYCLEKKWSFWGYTHMHNAGCLDYAIKVLNEETLASEKENFIIRCGKCNSELQSVRPGKYQCPNCE
jgi:hypothetical protein